MLFFPHPPPATIRERKVGKVAQRRGKQAIPPPVVPPSAEAVPPQSGGTTGACFPSCNGVWAGPRNKLARHRGTTLRRSRVTGVTNRASAGLAPLCNTPSRGRVATHARPSGTRRSLGPAALVSGVGTPPLGLSHGLTQHHRPRARRSVGMWHKMPCATCWRSLHRDTCLTLLGLCLGLLLWVHQNCSPHARRATGHSGALCVQQLHPK